jgi:iron-sulfur cluster insertion protein
MVEITDAAKFKLINILQEENDPEIKLRTFIQGGGCSGFQYGFTLDHDQNEDDFEFELTESYKLLIDAMSMQYFQGAVIDYKETDLESSFSIKNPNATSSCGCGNSFSV